MVDYNNDGATDLLIGNGEGIIYYYTNKGSNAQPVFSSPIMLQDDEGSAITVASNSSLCVVDWNQDNKKDLLVGDGIGTLRVCLNQGSDVDPHFAPPRVVERGGVAIEVRTFAAPFVADWNGDGKQDLLIGDGEGYVQLYLNSAVEGTPQLTTKAEKVQVNGIAQLVEGSAVPFLIDWNRDGSNELLVGSNDGHIYLVR
jgi:hypothetical protein